jgi:hypothetical protein
VKVIKSFEKHITSIVRIQKYAKQETNSQQAAEGFPGLRFITTAVRTWSMDI